MLKNGAIVIGFSKSSIEPLFENSALNLNKVHFVVLDKSDEEINCDKNIASITKLVDIYDIQDIIDKIKARAQ